MISTLFKDISRWWMTVSMSTSTFQHTLMISEKCNIDSQVLMTLTLRHIFLIISFLIFIISISLILSAWESKDNFTMNVERDWTKCSGCDCVFNCSMVTVHYRRCLVLAQPKKLFRWERRRLVAVVDRHDLIWSFLPHLYLLSNYVCKWWIYDAPKSRICLGGRLASF